MPSNLRDETFVLIPAFNEARRLGIVLEDLLTAGWKNIIVIDDGSRDGTAHVGHAYGVLVLEMLINRGQGAALRAGIEYAQRFIQPAYLVTFDADGQHSADDLPMLLQPLWEGRADITLGSRFLHPDQHTPLLRKIILKAGVWFTNIVSDIYLTDTHNGLRALNQKAYTAIRIRQRGMEHASEIIDEIKRRKLRFKEVPVTIAYNAAVRQKGQPTGGFLKLGLKYLVSRLAR